MTQWRGGRLADALADAAIRATAFVPCGASTHVADDTDKYALPVLPGIDCATRLHLCHARCCELRFALSLQDVDEGIVQWDRDEPYMIAQDAAGRCVHLADSKCSVYHHRPTTCRVYDCRGDARIWVDFERRIPAAVAVTRASAPDPC